MANLLNNARAKALKINCELPETVLLPPLPPSFTQRFDDGGAAWLCAEPDLLLGGDAPDISPEWRGRCGGVTAVPSKPNTGNTKRATLDGISGLEFGAQVNSGYCIPKAMLRDGPFSLAIIYAPSTVHEPRSLLTINPVQHDNYVFLCERDGAVELTDQQESFSLRQPVAQLGDGFRLVVLSYSHGRYALSINGQKPIYETSDADGSKDDVRFMDASALCDLFIGCRSHRKGILKTLGALFLADVFVWPDKDILTFEQGASMANDSPEHDLLLKYYTEVITRDV